MANSYIQPGQQAASTNQPELEGAGKHLFFSCFGSVFSTPCMRATLRRPTTHVHIEEMVALVCPHLPPAVLASFYREKGSAAPFPRRSLCRSLALMSVVC